MTRRVPAFAALLLSLAAPAAAQQQPMTPAAWRADLRFAVDSFLAVDRSFSPDARARFVSRVRALSDSAERLSDAEIITGLASAVALSDNAHTRLYLVRNRSEVRRLPVRIWWFADGPRVVAAKPEHAALLGARVTAICGHPVEQAARAVDRLYAGNDAWHRYMRGFTLTSPLLLNGLHLCPSAERTGLRLTTPREQATTVQLEALPLRPIAKPDDVFSEAWWNLAPTYPDVQGPWTSVLPADTARLPLYLRHPEATYWATPVPAAPVYYIQLNRADNAPTGPAMAQFADSALAEIRRTRPRKIVVDLRFNTGGNLQVGAGFMRSLAEVSREIGARLYVITGNATFSAGESHVAMLRQWGNAAIVGDGPGEGLEYWSEGGNLRMPNSRLTLHFANRMHRYARDRAPTTNPVELELATDRVTPTIPAPFTWNAYVHLRDPAMEAILHDR